ncbi:MAG: long-chain fatty acid--CoA ligase [Sciscionella sp.]
MLSTMQDGPLSIGQLLRYGTDIHGGKEVVTWTGEGGRRENYAETGRNAARLANALRSLGVNGDERVGTAMWNNNEHLVAYLAIPAMGAVLHTLNIRLPADQLGYIANHADDRVVLLDASLAPLFAKVLPKLETTKHVVVVGGDASAVDAPSGIQVHSYQQLLDAQSDEFDWPTVDERRAAAMCYTSGTTGNPKGVVYSHRSIWLHSMQVCMTDGMNLAESDIGLVIVPMFHAMSWGLPYASMMIGASMIMPDRFLQPEPIAKIMAEERPTMTAAVPTIWQGLLAHLDANPQDISHLRQAVVGGSACPPSLMRAFDERYNLDVIQAWGMTETSPLGTVAIPPSSATGEKRWEYRSSQGHFPATVRARLVDDDGSEVAWDGESVGELEVTGPWVAGSYYSPESDGAVDAEKFDNGWLRTGDVGNITADGYLRLTDRAKDVIKSGGEWISSVDLENQVMAHPSVAEAAVVGVPDPQWDERPLVAVVLADGTSATPDELRDFLTDKVAKWQLPDSWVFVDEVPKTSVGKFDKKRIRAQHKAGELDVKRSG